MANERIGFTIGADASEFSRELKRVSEEAERLEKIASDGGGLFASDTLRDYDQGLQRIQRSMRIMQQEYRSLSQEAARFQEELDDIHKDGGSSNFYQRAKLAAMKNNLSSLRLDMNDASDQRTEASAGRQGLAETAMRQRMTMGLALQHIPYAGTFASTYGVARDAGYGKGRSLSLASGTAILDFIKTNVQAGMEELISQQMGRMGVERTLGFAPGNRASNRTMGLVQGYGLSMGYSAAEALQFYQMTAKASGQSQGINAASNMAMMRGYSMDMGTLLGAQSTARHAGDTALAAEINKSMIRAFKVGGFSRPVMDEFVSSATTVLQTLSPGSTSTRASDAAGLLSVMSKSLGGVYSSSPLRTANLIQRMAGGFSASGDDASMGFKMQAMGFGTEKGVDYVEGIRRMERGPDAENIQRYLKSMNQWTGGDKRMNALGLYRIFGGQLKMHEALSLSEMNPNDLSGIQAQLARQTADPQKEAALTSSRTGLVRMDLAKKQQQAALTAQYMPVIETMWKANMMALKAAFAGTNWTINAGNVIINALKGMATGGAHQGGSASGGGAPPPNPKANPVSSVPAVGRNNPPAGTRRGGY